MPRYSQLEQAKYNVVHGYKGGAAALAPLMGKNEKTLDNKVNAHVETHHLTVDEAVAAQAITNNYQILHAEASQLGFVCIPMPVDALKNTTDTELLNLWADWQKEIADAAQAMQEALQDGNIEPHEVIKIRKELFESFAKGLELLQRFEALAQVST